MIKEVKELISEGLWDYEIKKMLNNDVSIYIYDKIKNFNHIDDLFKDSDNVVLLYETSKNWGHWVCLFKKNNTIYFFDSYGYIPDDELKFTHRKSHKILLNMMYESGYDVDYNNHQLQTKGKNIATCGRWCVERLKNKNMSTDDFAKTFFKLSKEFKQIPDFFITLLNIS